MRSPPPWPIARSRTPRRWRAVRKHGDCRSRITPDLSFTQASGRVRQSVLEAHARQESVHILADHLEQEGIDPASLLQVSFTLQNPLREPLDLPNVAVQSIGNVAPGAAGVAGRRDLAVADVQGAPDGSGSPNYKGELLDGAMVGAVRWRIALRCWGPLLRSRIRRSTGCSPAGRHDRLLAHAERGFTRQSCAWSSCILILGACRARLFLHF